MLRYKLQCAKGPVDKPEYSQRLWGDKGEGVADPVFMRRIFLLQKTFAIFGAFGDNYHMKQRLTHLLVKEARRLAWEGKKISDIARLLDCSANSLYAAVKGETWCDIKQPPPFNKKQAEVFTCSKCQQIFPVDAAAKGKWCKDCLNKTRSKEQTKRYREQQHVRERQKAYHAVYNKQHRQRLSLMAAQRYQRDKQKINQKRKLYDSNPRQILINRMRKALRRCLKRGTIGKFRHFRFTKDELVQHLMSTLPEGLTVDECHIDHIKPISSFDSNQLKDVNSDEFHQCWSLKNLRLISAQENLEKSNRLLTELIS